MVESVKDSLRKYIDFSGRATRREFWTFYFFCLASSILANLIDAMQNMELASNLIFLGLTMPLMSCGARRMHDIGKSGWFQLIPLYNLFLYAQPSLGNTQS